MYFVCFCRSPKKRKTSKTNGNVEGGKEAAFFIPEENEDE